MPHALLPFPDSPLDIAPQVYTQPAAPWLGWLLRTLYRRPPGPLAHVGQQLRPLEHALYSLNGRCHLHQTISSGLLLTDRSVFSGRVAHPDLYAASSPWRRLLVQLEAPIQPDVVILLDVPVATALERLRRRPYRMLDERAAILVEQRHRYHQLARQADACCPWLVVDAAPDIAIVAAQIAGLIAREVARRGLLLPAAQHLSLVSLPGIPAGSFRPRRMRYHRPTDKW